MSTIEKILWTFSLVAWPLGWTMFGGMHRIHENETVAKIGAVLLSLLALAVFSLIFGNIWGWF